MATATITLTTAGTGTGPFDLYSDFDGYVTPFETGVDKSLLVSGYTTSLVYNGTTIIRVQSTSIQCTNYIDLPVSGITTTTTTTTSTTTTTTIPPPTCVCYTVYYTGPPPFPAPTVQSTSFSYIDCSGATVNSSVGDGEFGQPSVDICTQSESSITITGGDNLAGWDESLFNCCTSNPMDLSYGSSLFGVCNSPTLVSVCADTNDICTATTLTNSDFSMNCSTTPASAGYYGDGTNQRYWDGGAFTTLCSVCSGCLVADTLITLSDGTTKLIQDVQVGDVLKSIDVAGMPLTPDQWYHWSSDTLDYVDSISTVIGVSVHEFDSVININDGKLIATYTHNHVVKQDDVWYIRTTFELNVGDVLLDIDNNEFEITSLVVMNAPITVYDIDVNNSNLYFANNTLTHNK
jgi:hypothetical protein